MGLSMSRRSVLLAVGVLVLLFAGAAAGLVLLLRHEPSFYREAEQPPGVARKKHSGEFLTRCSQLGAALREAREWSAPFTAEQINSFFAEGFPDPSDQKTVPAEDLAGPGTRSDGAPQPFDAPASEEKVLPDDIRDPRVRIDHDRLRLGFRYGKGWWSTIITIDLRVWVAANEPNVVALELQGMHAGALPITVQSLLEYVSETARRRNVDVAWYRHNGNPVALLHFQGKGTRTTVQLQHLGLEPGRLLIQGRSVDPSPVRTAPPDPAAE
jgi:hypothetical protein